MMVGAYVPPGGGGWVSIDRRRVGYVPPGGGAMVLLGESSSSEPPPDMGPVTVTLSAVTRERVTTVTATVEGVAADVDATSWTVTPSPASYSSSTRLTGRTAVFKNSARTATITAAVPRRDGRPADTATLSIERVDGWQAGVFPVAYTRGGTVKVEHSFRSDTTRSTTARLVRTASPGVPTERTVVETRQVTLQAGTVTVLSRDMSFTPPAGSAGHGYGFEWEVDVAPGVVQASGPLPVWVYGAQVRDQRLDEAPASIDYPTAYTRAATDSGQVTPAAGKTYADHRAAFLRQWKAQNLSQPIGGAWISFNDYNSMLYWVDLDDPSIPTYQVQHWDHWEWGYTLPGWYERDAWANPYPRERVAHIPIPEHATPSAGTDRSLAIVGMRGGQVEVVWEMWLAQRLPDGQWRAASIGRTTPDEFLRHSNSYTVAASGISALAYALRVREADAAVTYVRAERAAGRRPNDDVILGHVPHALAINMPDPRAWPNWSWPATFTDGSDPDPAAPWEGQLVYLRQDRDVHSLNVSPLKHVILTVAQHRGMRVTDKTSWSTTLIVEGDQTYGGGQWARLRDPGESWAITEVPDDWFILGKQYPARDNDSAGKAAFDADTTPPADPTPPAPVATLPFTDRERVTFTGAGLTSQIHTYAAGRQPGAGLVVWCHGDAAYEFHNPSSSYVMGGSSGVREVCRQRGMVLVSALAPDTTGVVTWWENGLTKAAYLKALMDAMVEGYATDPSRVVLAGFSGGAQQIAQFFMRSYPDYFSRGGLTVCVGGGQPPSTTPTYPAAVRSGLAMHWAAGANDTAANAPDGFDGRNAATNGEAWFRGRGFTRTSLQIIAGKGHDIGSFGAVLAAQIDQHLPA